MHLGEERFGGVEKGTGHDHYSGSTVTGLGILGTGELDEHAGSRGLDLLSKQGSESLHVCKFSRLTRDAVAWG